jgi:hypothetical protein
MIVEGRKIIDFVAFFVLGERSRDRNELISNEQRNTETIWTENKVS